VPWEYDSGEGTPKHRWNKPEAGWVKERGRLVSKCPNTITEELATNLLNSGIPYFNPKVTTEHPTYIYNVLHGVPYKARPTIAGRSYHGHPCAGRDIPNRRIREDLIARAAADGNERKLDDWLKEWP